MNYSVLKYDKFNKKIFEYSSFLNNFVFYKYETKKVTKITINPKFYNNRNLEYCDIGEFDLIDNFKIGNKKRNIGISNRYIRKTIFDDLGRRIFYKRINLQKDTVLKEKFVYNKDEIFEIIEYENQQYLIYNVSNKNLNNFIKILKDGRK